MNCEDRYWRLSEESNAEHVEDLVEEIRRKFALDEPERPREWEDSEESWHVAKKVDRLAADVGQFVDSGFTASPPDLAVRLEAIRGLRIRRVTKENPFAEVLEEIGVSTEEPYVAIDVGAEDLLRTLIRHRLGYDRRHWHLGRVIDVAASGIAVRCERSRAYLARMLRCYVLELEDETIVWARSVLEAELESLLEEDAANVSTSPLVDLIDKAGCLGVLGGSVFEAAHRVRIAGNDSLHVMVGLWYTEAVLRDLQIVLKALDVE